MTTTGLTVTEIGTGVGSRLASHHEERDLNFKKKKNPKTQNQTNKNTPSII